MKTHQNRLEWIFTKLEGKLLGDSRQISSVFLLGMCMLLSAQTLACFDPPCPPCYTNWPDCDEICDGWGACCEGECCYAGTGTSCCGSGCCNSSETCCNDSECCLNSTETCCGDNKCCNNISEICCDGDCCPNLTEDCCDSKNCYNLTQKQCCDRGDGSLCDIDEICCDDGSCVDELCIETSTCSYDLPSQTMCRVIDENDPQCEELAGGPGYKGGYCATGISEGPLLDEECACVDSSCEIETTYCVMTYDKVCTNVLIISYPYYNCECEDPSGLVDYTEIGSRTKCTVN